MTLSASSLPHPLGLTSAEFCRLYRGKVKGEPIEAYRRLFRHGRFDNPGMCVDVPRISREQREMSAEGEVIKFVLPVQGNGPGSGGPPALETESVLIPMRGRNGETNYTLCLSSQVGCAMGCTFCETAQMGLIRSLQACEIIAQWFCAVHTIGIRPRNIVFMGMGEPLDNLDQVIQAIAVLDDRSGPGVAMNKITVSTVGRVDGIRKLARQVRTPGWHRLNLALSLNAPDDSVRSAIMPINRRWNMAALRDAILEWPFYGGAKICFEYVLIPGVNDKPEHVDSLAEFLRPINTPQVRGMVNVIPYNPRRNSPWPAPDEGMVQDFLTQLINRGIYCKRRRTKGRDLMGACGQLGNPQIRRRSIVELTSGASIEG